MNSEHDECDAAEDDSEGIDNRSPYCEDCKWLVDAVRDLEQQRREATDQRSREVGFLSKVSSEIVRGEEVFLSKMKTLELRRNAALDVLAKHQELEHI
jgi:hypothetical protein